MTSPNKLAATMILVAFIFLVLAFLTSCVAVPVPPFGDRMGEAGTLHIRASVNFEPRVDGLREDARNVFHALDAFSATLPTRTLGDK